MIVVNRRILPIIYSCFIFMTKSMKTCNYHDNSVLKFHSKHIVYYIIAISCYEHVALIVCDPFDSKSSSETYGCLNKRPP
jgi:hypothetical protein